MDAAPTHVGDRDPAVGTGRDGYRQDEGAAVDVLLAGDDGAGSSRRCLWR